MGFDGHGSNNERGLVEQTRCNACDNGKSNGCHCWCVLSHHQHQTTAQGVENATDYANEAYLSRLGKDVSTRDRGDAEGKDKAEHLEPGLNEVGTFDIDEVAGKEEDGTEIASSSEEINQTSDGDVWDIEKADINDGMFGYLELIESKDRYEETTDDE